MELKIINTSDGSKTIYIPEMDEQYHSVNGALIESEHVFINAGYNFHQSTNPVVFEVGFGTGLNCLLTALAAEKSKRQTTCYSVEKYPLNSEIINQLAYGQLISNEAHNIFNKIHACEWEKTVQISEYFRLKKIKTDLKEWLPKNIKNFDIIYFDAFGPDKQPDMWNIEIFQKIYAVTSQNGVFVTYSAKGEVRRQLTAVGYQMERIPGPPGKKQMLRGIKNPPIL